MGGEEGRKTEISAQTSGDTPPVGGFNQAVQDIKEGELDPMARDTPLKCKMEQQ